MIPDNNQISTLFPTFAQDVEWIGHFNAEYNNPYVGHYQFYVGQAKFDDFTTLEYGQGYQVYCTNPNGLTVQITGKLPTSQDRLTLLPEWHLLPAIAVDAPQPLSWLLQGVHYDQIRSWNPTTQQLETPTQILPGESYFVHLVSASLFNPPLPRDVTTRFVYDGDGGRVKSITAAGTTTYLGESYEIAPDGTTTTYVFAGSQRIAAKDSTGALRFYHTDHLGSSNVVTNASGALVELNEHTPYGSLSRHEGTADVTHKFTGQRLDISTGLYFYNARYYDPQLGRFIQADTIVPSPGDPQALNRYSYCRNNPLTYTDPSGHGWKQIFGWVSTALSILLPPLAPILMAANIGLGLYDAAKTGNWTGFIGSTVGSLAGGAVFGSLGQQAGLGLSKALGDTAWRFAGGALMGAVEFGMAGFGSGFGGALGGGASFKEAFKAGGLSSAVSGGIGAGIQGSYMAGWQNTLHGMSAGQIAQAQGLDPSIGSALGADAGLRSRFGKTDVYRHYSYADEAAKLAGGLHPDSWGTKDFYTSGKVAQQKLSLPPHRLGDAPPNAVYNVFVDRTRTPVLDVASIPAKHFNPSRYAPQGAFRTGGGSGGYFPLGTPPGSVIYGGPVDP